MCMCSYGWLLFVLFFFFKQKTAYELRISDWSADVCSSDLAAAFGERALRAEFDLELARQILPFELLILADIGGDHFLDLLGAEQLAEALAVDAGIVAGDGEVLYAGVADRVDQPLGDAAQEIGRAHV